MERLEEVAEGVFVLHYAYNNQPIGVVSAGSELLVVDTRNSHRQAREILTDIETVPGLRGRRVTRVVNTHRHDDHAFGNHVFRPASIWSHVAAARGLAEHGEDDRRRSSERFPELADELAEVVIDPADQVFAQAAISIEMDGRAVELRHPGRGHTDGDIVVVVADASVIFTGDLVVNGEAPWFADSYPLEWPAAVAAIAALPVETFVPGHGEVVDRSGVEEMHQGLAELADLIELAANGSDVDPLVRRAPWAEATRVAFRYPGAPSWALRDVDADVGGEGAELWVRTDDPVSGPLRWQAQAVVPGQRRDLTAETPSP